MKAIIPGNLIEDHRTQLFTSENVPPALLKSHVSSRWAELHVKKGILTFFDDVTDNTIQITSTKSHVIVPHQHHHIKIDSETEFYIVFFGDVVPTPIYLSEPAEQNEP